MREEVYSRTLFVARLRLVFHSRNLQSVRLSSAFLRALYSAQGPEYCSVTTWPECSLVEAGFLGPHCCEPWWCSRVFTSSCSNGHCTPCCIGTEGFFLEACKEGCGIVSLRSCLVWKKGHAGPAWLQSRSSLRWNALLLSISCCIVFFFPGSFFLAGPVLLATQIRT